MRTSEIKEFVGIHSRITYYNKVNAINIMCGVINAVSMKNVILQPFGIETEIVIHIDRVENIEKILK